MLDPEIAAHYQLGLEESRLFIDGRARLEFVRTLELLGRALPPAPARVLDVGGGNGVYAAALCERGYCVDLLDPVERHVERARDVAQERGLTRMMTAALGDARDLGHVEPGYDAVLLLGPLYHLTRRQHRVQAWAEAIRVARPSGVVAGVGISRYASLIDGLRRRVLSDPIFRDIVERDLRDGQHRNPDVSGRPELFTTSYFHLPEELAGEAREAGLGDLAIFAIEGPGWIVENIDDLDDQLFAARAVESEPGLMGATSHIMATGTTPQ